MWKYLIVALLGAIIALNVPLVRTFVMRAQVVFPWQENRALTRSTNSELNDLAVRRHEFHKWNEHRLCRQDTDTFKNFLEEEHMNAPVVGCD